MRALLSSLVVGCLFVGCAGVDDEGGEFGTSRQAASNGENDNGTELTATQTAGAVVCSGGTGSVAFSGTVSTTGSVDSVEVTASVDGATAAIVDTIDPQEFTHDGRNKTASYSFSFTFANGTHTVQICFVQSGSHGRLPKTTCLDPISVAVDCATKKPACNQGVGNGAEGCDPGNSNHNQPSNDENGGTPGNPGRGK